MQKKRYKIIDRNKNGVLLETIDLPKKYKVRDIENDDIMITTDKSHAIEAFNNYNIEEIRKSKREMLEAWLEEFCE